MSQQRILIVEDDPASWDVLRQILEYHKLTVDVAESGEQAIHLLQQHHYHLAVLDLALPEMDGWQVLREMQMNPQTRTIPAIALTAYYTPSLARDAKKAGFVACFAKPVTPKFIENIQAILD